MAQLRHQFCLSVMLPGAHRFCHKIISWGGVSVEIDCLAFSPERLVLVDRKPVISHENVVVLEMKATFLRSVGREGLFGPRRFGRLSDSYL